MRIGAGLADGADAVHRVFAIVEVAVEKMLGIEDDFIDVLLQKRNRVAQDVEILFERNPQRLAHVEVPGLADHGRDRSVGLQYQLEVAILRSPHTRAARRAEGRDLRMLEVRLLDLDEKRRVAIVGAGPSALDVIDPEVVEAARDFNFIFGGE